MLKHQQFENSGTDKTDLKRSKCQQFAKHNNDKKQNLDKNKSEIKHNKYIFFSLFRKKSNHL